MMLREITADDKTAFDKVATHPLQSYAWGEWREKTKVKVERLGTWDGNKLTAGYQVTIHPLPRTRYTIGYFPRGPLPDERQIKALKEIGARNNCVMIKLEPNVASPLTEESVKVSQHKSIKEYLKANGCVEGRTLFTKYSWQVDLTKSEDELLAGMKPKTRYNIGVAQRHGVEIGVDDTVEAFEEYLRLTQETTTRQGFFAHTPDYHRTMWREMHKAGIAHLLVAKYQGKTLATWIFFVFNNVLYYPYGASSSENREVMASNLLMWEGMKWGKKMGCKLFDMWGALGPNPDPKDPWFGFHKFKEGYGGQLVEFVGSYDLVLAPAVYKIYRVAEAVRWTVLRIYAKLKSGRII